MNRRLLILLAVGLGLGWLPGPTAAQQRIVINGFVLELTRFRGHISSEEEEGVHDAKDTPTIFS